MESQTLYYKTNALSTTALDVGYGTGTRKNILLRNLNLSLPKGEMICFMGPNGIGKSTLIRTLAGLQSPLSGNIQYTSDKDLPLQVSVVLTDIIKEASVSVYELIAFGRYPYLGWDVQLHADDKRIIDLAIDRVNIASLTDKKLYQLSDGQMQMVMIARALAQDTDIILLDEPTAHLDLNNRVEIMNLLRQLSHRFNKAILIATHELDLALQTADKIWLAGRHKKVIAGLPEDLVLDGSFDEVFQFKGFDLRSGKIEHEAYRSVGIKLIGTGHSYLWTKNALERNGFYIATDSHIHIEISDVAHKLEWTLTRNQQTFRLSSIAALLNTLG